MSCESGFKILALSVEDRNKIQIDNEYHAFITIFHSYSYYYYQFPRRLR